MDFGIAKLASAETQLTHTGMAMGTAGYLPPEQIRGEKVDLRADIFSYGVLAYELMAGVRPFRGDNMSAVLFQIIGQDPEPLSKLWPECPANLERIIHKCLCKSPADRYSSLTPLLAELKPDARRSPSAVERPGRRAPRRPNSRRRWWPAVQTAAQVESLRTLERRLREIVEKGDLTAAELELTLARKKHGESQSFSLIFDPLVKRMDEIRRSWEEQRQAHREARRPPRARAEPEGRWRARRGPRGGTGCPRGRSRRATKLAPSTGARPRPSRRCGSRATEEGHRSRGPEGRPAPRMQARSPKPRRCSSMHSAASGPHPSFSEAQRTVEAAKRRHAEGVASALLREAESHERAGRLSEAPGRPAAGAAGVPRPRRGPARPRSANGSPPKANGRGAAAEGPGARQWAPSTSAIASGDLKERRDRTQASREGVRHRAVPRAPSIAEGRSTSSRPSLPGKGSKHRRPQVRRGYSGHPLPPRQTSALPLALVAGGGALVLLLAVGGFGLYWMNRSPVEPTPFPTPSASTSTGPSTPASPTSLPPDASAPI